MKKIVLVGVNAKFAHTNPAIRYLQQYCGQEQVQIAEYTINMEPEQVYEQLRSMRADVYGFSVYIWNVNYIYALADKLRRQTNALLLMGGPEVTFDAETALQHCDYVLSGEGEEAFAQFVQAFLNGQDVRRVPSICFMQQGKLHRNPPADYIDLEQLAQPYVDLDNLKRRLIYYESSRGCPFSCAYCLSSAEKQLRFASAEKVCRDIRHFAEKGVMKVKFVDRTFNADPPRAARIVRDINTYGGQTEFHFEIAADLIDQDFLQALAEAKQGKIQLEIGVQSTHEPTLKAIDRIQDFAYTRQVVREILSHKNVKVHLDLIAGLPLEGLAEFRKSFDDVMEVGAQVVQLGFLKVLKGSPMEQLTERYGIVSSEQAPYEVKYTDAITEEQLLELHEIEYLLERIYNSGLYYYTTHLAASAAGGYYAFFDALRCRLKQEHRNPREMGEQELALLLWRQMEAYPQEELLKDAIRLDWFLRPRRAQMPAALEKHAPWQREFYAHMPEQLAQGMPKGKRPWHYSRIESFCFDILHYLQTGCLKRGQAIYFFDYTSGKTPEIFPLRRAEDKLWQCI